ncbi:lectin like domain-containing protein [Lacrimispora celerecrescens]|uniref:Peptidase C1 n=1 Tax=Lacrimispora celerecrescens TaxID=29354 RepID=A0A084JLL6_9FIRM|nr:lectin like domain-containing protein [Lacrimispora celerecrescens]KEZ89850.1 peptidase C1 [Lacrimispora celerecrescens]
MKNKRWFFLFLMIICFSAGYRFSSPEIVPANKAGQDYLIESDNVQTNSQCMSWKSEILNVQLPAFYDGREEGRVPSVKNQGSIGTCWAFASLQALEAALLPGESYEFSEDHMSLNNGFCIPQEEGGEYTMSMAYLLSWRGPVLEADDPYGDGISPDGLKSVKHIQEIQILPDKDYEEIKRAVLLYGGVQSSLYTSLAEGDIRSESYNEEAYAYCYIGPEPPNHDSVIIGWDDAYPKENFHGEVQGDGAFICMNSWGDGFGDQGYFYVSYYDSNIGRSNIVYSVVEDTDNYDHIYQSDLRGWVGQLGYGEDTVWFSNVYEAGTSQRIEAAGFYATGPRTSYEIYVVRHVGKESDILECQDFDRKVLLTRGNFDYGGYYTVPLMGNQREDLELSPGERFAVIVKINTPDAIHPAAIEYDSGDGRTFVNISDGEGYISADGVTWERAEEKRCNLCLKVYTKDR